jgi:hypothetical protein
MPEACLGVSYFLDGAAAGEDARSVVRLTLEAAAQSAVFERDNDRIQLGGRD